MFQRKSKAIQEKEWMKLQGWGILRWVIMHFDCSRHVSTLYQERNEERMHMYLHHIPQKEWPTWNCLEVLLDNSPFKQQLSPSSAVRQNIKLIVKLWEFPSHSENLMSDTIFNARLLSRNLEIKIYKNTILPVVLHGCKCWSLILSKDQRLKVFYNKMIRRIYGPKTAGETEMKNTT